MRSALELISHSRQNKDNASDKVNYRGTPLRAFLYLHQYISKKIEVNAKPLESSQWGFYQFGAPCVE